MATATMQTAAPLDARHIPVELIDRDPDQPRRHFDEVALAELAESIRAHGVIQPVEVEATGDGRYRLHHGERRLRASKLAGRETIPAVVAPPRDAQTALVRGLLENLHREDLNAIEEGHVYRRLMEEMGWTQLRIARETGHSQALIKGRLAWTRLEPEIQRLVELGHLHVDGRLAEKLAILPPEVRVPLAEKLAARGVGLNGSLAACERAAEAIVTRAEATERGKARHAEAAAAAAGPGRVGSNGTRGANGTNGANGHRGANGTPVAAHAVPMVAYGLGGRTAAPVVVMSIRDAAEAVCRACNIRPRGVVSPAWALVEQAAAETCAACVKRDGPAMPEVCRNCPGVELVRRLVAGVEVQAA